MLLLDTNALFRWWAAADMLADRIREAIVARESPIYVSSVSAWEIATKHRIGKLPEAGLFLPRFAELLARDGFLPLSVTVEHALEAGRLPSVHKDPFDRLIAAQARLEKMAVATSDRVFADLGVTVLW
jgi:PIN domain nuclease of toxin-antitoxin system